MSTFKYPKTNPPEKRHGPLQKEEYQGIGTYAAERKSLREMEAEFKASRETIRNVLIKRNLHKTWKEGRKEVKKQDAAMRKDVLKGLAETIYLISLKKAEESRPLRKALERHYKKKHHISFESVVSLFETYYKAKDSGEKLSLMEIGERCGISFTCVGRILEEAGEKPLYGAKERKLLSEEKNRLAENAVMIRSELCYTDIGKIIGVPYYVLRTRAWRIGKKKHPRPSLGHPALTYSKAIDLFEALDTGFSKADAMQYAQINSDREYEVALARRGPIEKEVYEFRKKMGLQ